MRAQEIDHHPVGNHAPEPVRAFIDVVMLSWDFLVYPA
jgi:hypothetical protein